jgi:hypothetical protein
MEEQISNELRILVGSMNGRNQVETSVYMF